MSHLITRNPRHLLPDAVLHDHDLSVDQGADYAVYLAVRKGVNAMYKVLTPHTSNKIDPTELTRKNFFMLSRISN